MHWRSVWEGSDARCHVVEAEVQLVANQRNCALVTGAFDGHYKFVPNWIPAPVHGLAGPVRYCGVREVVKQYMPLQSGEVFDIHEAKKLAIVQHEDWTFSVLGWVEGTPLGVGHCLHGNMGTGGWARLTNTSTGTDFMAYKHLTGCPLADAFVFYRY